MINFNNLYNTFFNTRLKFFRIISKICLVGCTFVNINSTDMFLGNIINMGITALGGSKNVLSLLGSQIFTGERNHDVPGEFTKHNICILFHGLGGNANEIKTTLGDKIAAKFNCDVISLEYNNFDITDIQSGITNLVNFFNNLRNSNGLQGRNLIIIGYSLGVNIAALFANELRKLGIKFDFICYKGYKDLYSVIKTNDEIIKQFIRKINCPFQIDKDTVIDIVKACANSNDHIKKLVEMTDNLTSIKNLGLKAEILNNGLAKGHLPNANDIDVIHAEYERLKNGDSNKYFILLCQTQGDNIVGSGMQEVYNELTRTGTDDQKKAEDDSTPAACDCYKCGQNNSGSQGSKSSTNSNG